MDDEKYQKARDYALKLLSFRPRTKLEISKKLSLFVKKKSLPKNLVDQVIEELISQNLIDDFDFVTWWIEQRDILNPKGKKLLTIELREKGIAQEIIDSVFNNISGFKEKEFNLAKTVIVKKFPLYQNLPTKEARIKLARLLVRRGFDWETINKVIDSFWKKS